MGSQIGYTVYLLFNHLFFLGFYIKMVVLLIESYLGSIRHFLFWNFRQLPQNLMDNGDLNFLFLV